MADAPLHSLHPQAWPERGGGGEGGGVLDGQGAVR